MAEFAGVLPPGSRLQEYEIERVLGRPGGFGITYLATDVHLAKQVAIKEFLPTEFAVRGPDDSVTVRSADDSEAFRWGLKSFLNEARVLARFRHKNIVEVYRYFEAHHTAYIVMEYVQGETLHELLKRESTLDEPRIRAILLPILEGLQVLHDAGVVHRDIKPDNIIIRADGEPCLIDFGAARNALGSRSSMLSVLLTPGYAPVEQYSVTGTQGPWTDIYALGAVTYRMIDGKRPCDSIQRIDRDELIPASRTGAGRYSPQLLAAIDRALAVHAGSRPQSVAEWRAEITGEAPPVVVAPATTAVEPPTAEPTTILAPPPADPAPVVTRTERAAPVPTAPLREERVADLAQLAAAHAQGARRRRVWPGVALAAALLASLGFAAERFGLRPAVLMAHLDAPKIVSAPTPVAPTSVAAAFVKEASLGGDSVGGASVGGASAPTEPATQPESPVGAASAATEVGAKPPPTRASPTAATDVGAIAPPTGGSPTAATVAAKAAPAAESSDVGAEAPPTAQAELASFTPAQPPLPETAQDELAAAALEPEDFAGMLAAHNRLRERYGVAPIQWSAAAEQDAQQWAQQLSTEGCPLKFNPDPARRGVFRENLMNVFANQPYQGWRRTPEQVVERWAKAEPLYDAQARRCRSPTGGCTQFAKVVDATVGAVGCGRARCETGEIWVCSYSPTG